MNITLSANEKLIGKTRQYATRHGTSLNHMIRQYMKNITGEAEHEQNAKEFARLARQCGGASPKGFVFNRKEAHKR